MIESLSIVTPHKDNLEGLRTIFNSLKGQTSDLWEWIIVDDCSDASVVALLKNFEKELSDDKVRVIFNERSRNASVCRNLGADSARFTNLVFLDSDDFITDKFVSNRNISVKETVYFTNIITIDQKGHQQKFSNITGDYLTNYLKGKFAWQTTGILWNKFYFDKIGKFDDNFPLLQDVEVSIRALKLNSTIITTNPEPDFFYYIQSIDIKKRNFGKVCLAVNLLLDKIYSDVSFSRKQLKYIRAYYFLAIRYFCRTKEYDKVALLHQLLKKLYQNKSISFKEYLFGKLIVFCFTNKVLGDKLFLKYNRYFFKSN